MLTVYDRRSVLLDTTLVYGLSAGCTVVDVASPFHIALDSKWIVRIVAVMKRANIRNIFRCLF